MWCSLRCSALLQSKNLGVCCRTALEQNHCSGVKFRNDVPDFSIAVDVAESITLHCNAQNAPEQNFGMNSINKRNIL